MFIFMVDLPVRTLAVLAAVIHKAASGAGQKLYCAARGSQAVAEELGVRGRVFLARR